MNLMNLFLLDGWTDFTNSIDAFFKQGLGQTAAPAIGWAMIVIGIVWAVVAFFLKKSATQSYRGPGPVVMLCVAAAGTVLIGGIGEGNIIVNAVISFGNFVTKLFAGIFN